MVKALQEDRIELIFAKIKWIETHLASEVINVEAC